MSNYRFRQLSTMTKLVIEPEKSHRSALFADTDVIFLHLHMRTNQLRV